MKRKIIYMFVFIISLNTFSFAKQQGKNCDKKNPAVTCSQKKSLSTEETGSDISPLNLLLL